MLKHCGNYAAVLTNYASFLHLECFSNSPRTYVVRVKTWTIKNIGTLHANICWRWCTEYTQDASWFLLSLLQINTSAFRAFRWHNTNWWTRCHWHTRGTVLKLCSRDMQLDHTIFKGKSHIMLAFCHNLKAADYAQNYPRSIPNQLSCHWFWHTSFGAVPSSLPKVEELHYKPWLEMAQLYFIHHWEFV